MSRKLTRSAIAILLMIVLSFACNLPFGQTQANTTGVIKIINSHVRGSDPFPGGKNLPDAREYGVCIINYPPGFPAGSPKPTFDMILAKDGLTTTFELPAGTYTLQEFQFDSEINQDPLYSPAMKTFVRPTETVALNGGQTLSFGSERTLKPPGDFVEGSLANPACGGAVQPGGSPPTDTPVAATPSGSTGSGPSGWVLKLVQPDVGKTETQFSYPGLSCSGGTKATSTETSATITATGTCQIKGAVTANQVTSHSWSRPPDRLEPGQEYSGTLAAGSTGLCSWQDSMTEKNCSNSVTTSTSVWLGDGWPGGQKEFPYSNLVFGNDFSNMAKASTHPSGTFKWTVPDGSTGGGKTLVIQFCSSSSGGKVYTNFWYEWQGK